MGYDRLVVAVGSVNKLLPIPGITRIAHRFRRIPEALSCATSAAIPANRSRTLVDWVLEAMLTRQCVQLGLVRSGAAGLRRPRAAVRPVSAGGQDSGNRQPRSVGSRSASAGPHEPLG